MSFCLDVRRHWPIECNHQERYRFPHRAETVSFWLTASLQQAFLQFSTQPSLSRNISLWGFGVLINLGGIDPRPRRHTARPRQTACASGHIFPRQRVSQALYLCLSRLLCSLYLLQYSDARTHADARCHLSFAIFPLLALVAEISRIRGSTPSRTDVLAFF